MAIQLQEVSVPGCVDCARFKRLWEEKLSKEFPQVVLQEMNAITPEGQEMVAKFGIMASPGIIINGELFSVGAVNEAALRQKLAGLNSGS
jgi:glutaredoxin